MQEFLFSACWFLVDETLQLGQNYITNQSAKEETRVASSLCLDFKGALVNLYT